MNSKSGIFIATFRLLIAGLVPFLLGCAGSASSIALDPLTSAQIVVYPLQDLRIDKKTKISCVPVRPVASKYLSGLTHSIVHYAIDEGLHSNITHNDLLTANRQALKAIPTKGEGYALFLVLSKWEYGAFTFNYDLAGFLVRTSDGEMVWSHKANANLWRGLVQGPLEKLQSFGSEPYDFHYGNALQLALRGIPKNLPK